MIRNLKAGTLVHMEGIPVRLTKDTEANADWHTIDALARAAVEGSDDEAAFEIPGIEQTVAEAASELLRSERKAESRPLHLVFTDFPGPSSACVFVEAETQEGRSVNIGEWRRRKDMLVELVIPSVIYPE